MGRFFFVIDENEAEKFIIYTFHTFTKEELKY